MSEVIIYSTDACPYCHMAKDFLKKSNVKFKEFNVGDDDKARDRMIEKSGQMGVPQIEIDGKIIVGFDKEAIKKALKIKWLLTHKMLWGFL